MADDEEGGGVVKPEEYKDERKIRDLTEKEYTQVYDMAMVGTSVDNIGLILGFARSTWYVVLDKYPTIGERIKKGDASGGQAIEKTAFQMALSGKFPAMTMFWLKTRRQWREVSKVEHEIKKVEFKTVVGEGGKLISTEEQFKDDDLLDDIKSVTGIEEEPKK